jgi:predicted DNA-binding protein (MmcQ/YjbR family)
MPKPRPSSAGAELVAHLRELGLRRYPGAHIKSPWPGHLDLAVKDKTFAYLSAPGDPPGVSFKLPHSSSIALDLDGAEPTAYGLGKSGWVSLSFENSTPPKELLETWLDESYCAQAPKQLLAQFLTATGTAAELETKPRRKARTRKT